MNIVTAAIWTLLKNDTTLTNQLGTFADGTNTVPSIFTGPYNPDKAGGPLVFIEGPITDIWLDCKDPTEKARELSYYVMTYVKRGQGEFSEKLADTIGQRIQTLLHNTAITITGYTNIITTASGPRVVQQVDKGVLLEIELKLTIV